MLIYPQNLNVDLQTNYEIDYRNMQYHWADGYGIPVLEINKVTMA